MDIKNFINKGVALNKQKSPINIQRKSSKSNLEYVPEEIKKIARDMDSQFAKLMIQKMKATVSRNEEPSTANQIYESYMSDEYSKAMAQQNNGTGVQELILDQIYPHRYRNKITYEHYLQNQKDLIERFKRNKVDIEE
ncbi:MAG: rod-binding protein [Bdellovibrionales bacterium]|jgi:Rod binding domain-containing protein|nr:rod-binding protein [Bdellovibrionales bacterium]